MSDPAACRPLTPGRALADIAVVVVTAAVVLGVGLSLVGDNPLAGQAATWVANVAMLIAIWAGLRRGRQTWAHLGLGIPEPGKRLKTLWQSVVVFVAALAAFALGSFVAGALLGAPAGSDLGDYRYLQGNLPMLLLALVAVFIVSSFGEEVLYRGFLMTRIAEILQGHRRAWAVAAVVSAIVFGLVHFGWGLFGVIQTTFMGLALAVAYLMVGRNLWPLVLAHAYLDTVLLVGLYLQAPAGPA